MISPSFSSSTSRVRGLLQSGQAMMSIRSRRILGASLLLVHSFLGYIRRLCQHSYWLPIYHLIYVPVSPLSGRILPGNGVYRPIGMLLCLLPVLGSRLKKRIGAWPIAIGCWRWDLRK